MFEFNLNILNVFTWRVKLYEKSAKFEFYIMPSELSTFSVATGLCTKTFFWHKDSCVKYWTTWTRVYFVQLFSAGRTLRGHEVSKRGVKNHEGWVEILALCTQQCGGSGDGQVPHSLSLDPVGQPDNCHNFCNVTSFKKTRRHSTEPQN